MMNPLVVVHTKRSSMENFCGFFFKILMHENAPSFCQDDQSKADNEELDRAIALSLAEDAKNSKGARETLPNLNGKNVKKPSEL